MGQTAKIQYELVGIEDRMLEGHSRRLYRMVHWASVQIMVL